MQQRDWSDARAPASARVRVLTGSFGTGPAEENGQNGFFQVCPTFLRPTHWIRGGWQSLATLYLDLVPVLQHARADVLESSGKPLALVAAQFARARDIRKRSGRAMDPAQPPQRTTPYSAANAAMNLARVLTCQSQEVIDVANKQHRLGRLSAGACSFGDPMPRPLSFFSAPRRARAELCR